MPDFKIHDLPDIGTPAATDVLYVVGTPGGTPTDKKVQVQNLRGKSVDSPADFIVTNGAASAFDYEFEGATTSLPSGWSWLNQGAATYTEALGAGVVAVPTSAGYNWRGLVQTITGTSWLATCKLTMAGVSAADLYFGMLLRESSSSKLLSLATSQQMRWSATYEAA